MLSTQDIVPVAQFGSAPMATFVPCQLCRQPVTLENARIDERGQPVHEQCYLAALKTPKPTIPPPDFPTEPGNRV